MSLGTPNQPCSPHQRLYIRTLFEGQELPLDYITKLNFRPFEKARLPLPTEGKRVDGVLEALTRKQAAQLIDALVEMRDSAKA